ncbi:MAG: hypothetical protein HQM16_00885 [Deltaproteobacteria bacterium]|nr:hypothetical protein [Deltaproteobacteria bacterium]
MKRHEFEHTIRAAGAILGVNKVLVIGSQAIHASIDFDLPEAQRSIEANIAALNDKEGALADLIDGSIGELSMFQESFGYYAQGVTTQTAVLPGGWQKRLVPFLTPATNGVTALCLEPHDLWISKAIAGRPKDFDFCGALLKKNLVQIKTLRLRLKGVKNIKPQVRSAISKMWLGKTP